MRSATAPPDFVSFVATVPRRNRRRSVVGWLAPSATHVRRSAAPLM